QLHQLNIEQLSHDHAALFAEALALGRAHLEAETRRVDVAAADAGDQLFGAARLRRGDLEVQTIRRVVQAPRAGAGSAEYVARVVVSEGQNVRARRQGRLEGAVLDDLYKARHFAAALVVGDQAADRGGVVASRG